MQDTVTVQQHSSSEDSESSIEMEMLKQANSSTSLKKSQGKVSSHVLKKKKLDEGILDCFNSDQETELQPKKRSPSKKIPKSNKQQQNKQQVTSSSSLNAKSIQGSKEASRHDKGKLSKKVCTFNGSSESEDSDTEIRKNILRSAEKRINSNLSTSESDTKNVLSKQYFDSSDSDSAPENVTFENGRKAAMEVLKQAVDSIRIEKQRKKEQRKKRLEFLKQQKEEKLIRLKKSQSNAEITCSDSADSSTQSVKKQDTSKVNKDKDVTAKKITHFSSGSETTENKKKCTKNLKRLPASILDDLPDQIPQKQLKRMPKVNRQEPSDVEVPNRNSQLQWDTDYIPLETNGATQFGVVPLDTTRKKSVAEVAASFRHNLLYGDKTKRVQNNTHIISQVKLRAVKIDRLVTPN